MMSSSSHAFLSSHSAALQTSEGALVVHFYGFDFPCLTAEFLHSIRAQYWVGGAVCSIIPDHAVIFSASPAVLFAGGGTGARNIWELLRALRPDSPLSQDISRFHTALTRECDYSNSTRMSFNARNKNVQRSCADNECAAGSLRRRGVFFVPAASGSNERFLYFGITVRDHPAGSPLEEGHVAIGEIAMDDEGEEVGGTKLQVLTASKRLRSESNRKESKVLLRLQRLPYGPLPTGSTASLPVSSNPYLPSWPRPLRLTRLFSITVLPCFGQPLWTWALPGGTPDGGAREENPAIKLWKRFFLEPFRAYYLGSGEVKVLQRLSLPNTSSNTAETPVEAPLVQYWHPELNAVLGGSSSSELSRWWRENGSEPGVALLVALPCLSVAARKRYSSDPSSSELLLPSTGEEAGEGGASDAPDAKERAVVENLSLALHLLDGIHVKLGEEEGKLELLQPCERTLFICRLNPNTTSEGLAECFAAFGPVLSANVIRDAKTGASLRYGFVEFTSREKCFMAAEMMNNALIDDRRIKTDFSQSVRKAAAKFYEQGRQ